MMNQYVVGFLFSPDQTRVALIRKKRPDWQSGLLNGIGGKIESYETAREAMRREFREEAGVSVENWDHYCTIAGDTSKIYFFHSTGNVHSVETMEDEEVSVFEVADIGNLNTVHNLRWLLPLARNEDDLKVHAFKELIV